MSTRESKHLTFLLLAPIIASLLIPIPSSMAGTAPTWLRPGMYVNYQANVTMQQGQSYSHYTGTMSWTVTGGSNGTVFITESVNRDQDSLERTYEVEQASRRILRLDGKPVENQTTFFWIETGVVNGSLIQLENLTFTVVAQEMVDVGKISRPCWVLNGTFNSSTVEGVASRWYDVETGLMLKFFVGVGFNRGGEVLSGGAWIGAVETSTWEPRAAQVAASMIEGGAASLAVLGLAISLATLSRRRSA